VPSVYCNVPAPISIRRLRKERSATRHLLITSSDGLGETKPNSSVFAKARIELKTRIAPKGETLNTNTSIDEKTVYIDAVGSVGVEQGKKTSHILVYRYLTAPSGV